MPLIITKHAYIRAKKRFGWSARTLEKMAARALKNNTRSQKFTQVRKVIYYGGVQYIFVNDKKLLSVFKEGPKDGK